MTFKEFLHKTRSNSVGYRSPRKLLSIDPGHTTGWSIFENGDMTSCGQVDTVIDRRGNNEGTVDWRAVEKLVLFHNPTHVLYEDYRVYGHKLDRHSNSQVLTIRIIGVIDYLARIHLGAEVTHQSASVAKGFCDDKKLKMWGLYTKGQRHSRDSIRHAVYYLLFNKELVHKSMGGDTNDDD